MGSVAAGVTVWYRRRKARLLSRGILVKARDRKLRHTSTSVNGQIQHRATIEYKKDGDVRKTQCNIYGEGADKARRAMESKKTVRVLVDPKYDNHVICTDCPMLFDP